MRAKFGPDVIILTDPALFAQRVHTLIHHDPVRNSVLATTLQAAVRRGSPQGALWILVRDGGAPGTGVAPTGSRLRHIGTGGRIGAGGDNGTGVDVVLAGMVTPPHPLWLTPVAAGRAGDPRDNPERFTEQVLTALAKRLAADPSGPGRALPGVRGAIDSARLFAKAWQLETGRQSQLQMAQRMYQLTELVEPTGVPGRARAATPGDLRLCVDWMQAFHDEAIPYEPFGEVQRTIQQRIAGGGLFLWLAGGHPVAMAGTSATVAGVARIGPVYTPPGRRRLGYGSAVAAAATRAGLASGAHRCMLITDLANPTSNAVYQRLGYRPAGDAADYTFIN